MNNEPAHSFGPGFYLRVGPFKFLTHTHAHAHQLISYLFSLAIKITSEGAKALFFCSVIWRPNLNLNVKKKLNFKAAYQASRVEIGEKK